MTNMYRTHDPAEGNDPGVLHPTRALADREARARRLKGAATNVEKLTLRKMPRTAMLAAVYNRDLAAFVEETATVKTVKGVKKPKRGSP